MVSGDTASKATGNGATLALILVPQAAVTVGEFRLTRLQKGSFIISHASGEAMECSQGDLEQAIREFWKETF